MSAPTTSSEVLKGPTAAAPVRKALDELSSPERQAKSSPLYIPSLDGVRALSFMIVFVAHAGLGWIVPGYFGLSLFFFLSGYLITTLLRVEFERSGDVSLRQFYLRRALRIFPPFYVILGVAMLVTALGLWEGSLTVKAILYQTFHLTNYYIVEHGWWTGMAPGTWVYWSLAIEEHFYLVFPLVYLLLRRRGLSAERQAMFLVTLCVIVLIWRCVLVFGFDAPKDRMYVSTDTRVDAILAGCILAIWKNPALEPESSDERALKWVWLPLGGAAVLLSLALRIPEFEQTFRYTLQSFGLIPFFIAAVRFHDRGVLRLLNLRFVRFVGVLSYSMYLMHTSLLWGLGQWTNWSEPVRGLVALAALIAAGTLIHHYIEKPCAELRRKLSGASKRER
jgi:peptidoglycan/LPS O-acetylase OafA/YrhL